MRRFLALSFLIALISTTSAWSQDIPTIESKTDHLIFYAVSNLAVAPHIDGRCADHKGPRVIWEFSAT